jgi:plasmid replication initiation protein
LKNTIYIKKPNHISTARFTLSTIEYNIIYFIIDELTKSQSYDVNLEYFEKEIVIELKKIDKNNNYQRIKNSIKTLASKQVEYHINIPGGNGKSEQVQENVTSLISGIKYVRNSQYISFIVPSQACRFFCYLGGGFTSIQKTIAIGLSSIYSKALYELCCRWKDKGGYCCNIEDLKVYLSIENKYNQIAHFRQRVLDDSINELKEKADLFFSYTLIKSNKKYDKISIKIHGNIRNKSGFSGVKEEHYRYVYVFLNRFFPNYKDSKALDYTEILVNQNNLEKAYYRFAKLDDNHTDGSKTKKDIYNLLVNVILPELEIPKSHTTKIK